MNSSAISRDGVSIHFESSGQGETALLFVHGWIGNLRWWDTQRDAFSKQYRIIQMDLAGHGKSSSERKTWSVRSYAEDIRAVVEKLDLKKVVLVGHSMSGSHVIDAYTLMPERIPMLILVDTLHDLDHLPSMKEMSPFFDGMRQDYLGTVQAAFPQFMFAKTSPQLVIEQVVREASAADPETAIASLLPFYSTDIRKACTEVKVPVRAINSDLYPTNAEANRKFFPDFDFELIKGMGHYPMMEAPQEFNAALKKVLGSL